MGYVTWTMQLWQPEVAQAKQFIARQRARRLPRDRLVERSQEGSSPPGPPQMRSHHRQDSQGSTPLWVRLPGKGGKPLFSLV